MIIEIVWWWFPTFITVVLVGYAIFIYDDGWGYFSGLGNFILLVPALAVSLITWVIAAILK